MKKTIAIGLMGIMVLNLAACSGETQPAETQAQQQETAANEGETSQEEAAAGESFDTEYNWALATTYGSTTVVVQAYEKFAELASQYTDGAVTITVYPDGQLASENDSMSQLSAGELEFVGTGSMPWWLYSTDYAWTQAPFMITDRETYMNVYDSDVIRQVRQSWADEYHVKDLCGGFYRGMRKVVATKKLESVEDLSGLKLRMNSSALWNSAWQALGAVTVPLSLNELYTSIQTGVVEGCENPLSESGYLNVPEVVDYVINTDHVVEVAIICMNNDLFESLPAPYQEALLKAGQEAIAWGEEQGEAEEEQWLKAYQDAGCEVVEFDVEAAREACIPFWESQFESGEWAMSYEEVMALIEECSAE